MEGVPYIARLCMMIRMVKRMMISYHHSESDGEMRFLL
jgi:hypothetical protein